jgi:hypothetical protein
LYESCYNMAFVNSFSNPPFPSTVLKSKSSSKSTSTAFSTFVRSLSFFTLISFRLFYVQYIPFRNLHKCIDRPECPKTNHRSRKGLNNRVENAHQPTRRKEESLIKFKSPKGAQLLKSLMGNVRNLFAVCVNRYKHKSPLR